MVGVNCLEFLLFGGQWSYGSSIILVFDIDDKFSRCQKQNVSVVIKDKLQMCNQDSSE
jgi:hypothetical protein